MVVLSSSGQSSQTGVTMAISGAAQAGPAIISVNTADGTTDIAQNAWIEIKGTNLAPANVPSGGVTWDNAPEFASGRMPTQLNGVSVTVNGKPAFVYFVSAAQVNVLTPLDATTGSVSVVVTQSGTSSVAFTANLKTAAPAFALFGATKYIASTHADGSLNGPASLSVPGYVFTPAQPGETIALYGFGFGPPSGTLVNGSSMQNSPLATLPMIQIGGIQATVSYAGVIGPGLYQFNVVVPSTAANGDNLVTCSYVGASTPVGALISVQR
jgi:uncharacterized protein (TIGR03437 family)